MLDSKLHEHLNSADRINKATMALFVKDVVLILKLYAGYTGQLLDLSYYMGF